MTLTRVLHQQFMQLRWHLLACVGVIMVLPVEETIVNLRDPQGHYQSGIATGVLTIAPLLAALIACANVQADLDDKRDLFWRSKPVRVGAFITTKFMVGLLLALAVLLVPVVFICENNQYAMSFPARSWTTSERLAGFAENYGMPGASTDGNNLLEVKEAVQTAVDHARAGNGPSLIVNNTYRWRGHSKSDRNRYRIQEEIEEWQDADPILRYRKLVVADGLFSEEELDQIAKEGYAAIESARQFAEASPEPSVETILEGVYAP